MQQQMSIKAYQIPCFCLYFNRRFIIVAYILTSLVAYRLLVMTA